MYSFLKDIAHFRNSSNNNKKIQGPPYILALKERSFFSKCVVGIFKIILAEYMSCYRE